MSEASGFLYCAKSGDLAKIGFSRNPEARILALRAEWRKPDISLYDAVPAIQDTELDFHRRHRPEQIQGMREWYPANSTALVEFEARLSGTDVSDIVSATKRPELAVLTFPVPSYIKRQLRILAAERSTSMNALLTEALLAFLENRGGTANTSTPPSAAAN